MFETHAFAITVEPALLRDGHFRWTLRENEQPRNRPPVSYAAKREALVDATKAPVKQVADWSPAGRPSVILRRRRQAQFAHSNREEALTELATVSDASARRLGAPKPEDDAIAPGSQGPRRDFRISVGRREGLDSEGRVFDVSAAVRTARAWMKRKVEAGQPALSGMFTCAGVAYPRPRPDGTGGSDREPVAEFTGEAVHACLGQLPDADIEAMLKELAAALGAALGQERIHRAFFDRTWILDAGDRQA